MGGGRNILDGGHEVALVIEGANDDSTPVFKIQQFCVICRVWVSERIIDVSQAHSLDPATITGNATADGEAWLNHCLHCDCMKCNAGAKR